jgi:hypothetical protein
MTSRAINSTKLSNYIKLNKMQENSKNNETDQLGIGEVSTSVSVPAARVRFYPTDTDETFDGTVIDEKKNYYVVIPDQNLQLIQNWNKIKCDVIR